jgi:serine/threonine protein kinase
MLKEFLTVMRLNKGIRRCESCREMISFKGLEGLRVQQCPVCKTPFFVPYKLKHYWLYKPLGAGGYGSVYKALSTNNFKKYAIKLLSRHEKHSQEHIDTLVFEGRVGAVIGKHPHLVRAVEHGKEGNEYYLVNELINGERLDHVLQGVGRIPELLAYQIILQILDTEEYIYKQGFLYRDLKPENVLIDKNGKVTLLDYGLCCTVDEAESGKLLEDHFEGSPHFIPPERIIGAPEGQYSEIYSIGMLFYNILCANTYFKPSKGIQKLILQHVKSIRLPSVRYNLNHCHKITNAIIDRMIAKSPKERFNSYTILRKALLKAYKKVKKTDFEKVSSYKEYTTWFYAEGS